MSANLNAAPLPLLSSVSMAQGAAAGSPTTPGAPGVAMTKPLSVRLAQPHLGQPSQKLAGSASQTLPTVADYLTPVTDYRSVVVPSSPTYRNMSPQILREPQMQKVEVLTVNSSMETALAGVQAQVRELTMALMEERQHRQRLEAELLVHKARLDRIDPPESPLRAAIRAVEQRGNLKVSHETGFVTLLRPLAFEPRTTKEAPTAVLREPDTANAVCRDLAELSNVFSTAMTIEGHTKGGESEFWQTLADNRASVIADKIISYGAKQELLRTQGLPGRLGKNEVRTDVYFDIGNIKDELNWIPAEEAAFVLAAPSPAPVIQGTRIVTREEMRAAPIVTAPTILTQPIVADHFAGGQVSETIMSQAVSDHLRQGYRPISPRPSPATIRTMA